MRFALFCLENEIPQTEELVKKSDMEYVETKKLSFLDKLMFSDPFAVPDLFGVYVEGTKEQFDKLVNSQGDDLTRLF